VHVHSWQITNSLPLKYKILHIGHSNNSYFVLDLLRNACMKSTLSTNKQNLLEKLYINIKRKRTFFRYPQEYSSVWTFSAAGPLSFKKACVKTKRKMQHWSNNTDRRILKYLEKPFYQCHFVYHKLRIDRRWISDWNSHK
jgi:hypothetical protein